MIDAQIIIQDTDEEMAKAVAHTLHEFSTLHTGKASPGMVETIHVHIASYGGTSMPLKEIAAITTPDLRTIQIEPWDKSVIKDIEKSIQTANLGFNPTINSGIIRIPIPELSGERRKELVKITHTMAEEGRIRVRHSRREGIESLRKMQKKSDISEDDCKRYEKEIQTQTDRYIDEIGKHLARKEKELMAV